MTRVPYTAAEDAVLVARYATESFQAIAARLGRSYGSIQRRASRLVAHGTLKLADRFYHRPWTEDEEEYLSDHWGHYSDETVAAHLGRTVEAVHLKGTRLGLCRRLNVWTAADVARLFGIDPRTVGRWLGRGWIKGKKAPFGSGGKNGEYRAWSIDEDSVEHFVETHGWAFDHRHMIEGEYLTRLAVRLHKADPWLTLVEAAQMVRLHPGTLNRWALREGLAHQRRPKYDQAGPWAGLLVIQRSVLLAYVEARQETVHRNRSASARERARRRGWRVGEVA